MRRIIIFLTTLTLTLLTGAGVARADAPGFEPPLPATLRARTVAGVGSPGSLVPVEGTLLDAKRRPLTGVPVVVTVNGIRAAALESLTGSGGAFEMYVPLPEELPAPGTAELTVSFEGTAEAAASSMTLPVRVEAPAAATTDFSGPAPAATTPARNGDDLLPSSGSALIDQLIVVAVGLLGVMVLLFGVGAFMRRRRG